MGTKLGNASRARRLARLMQEWRRAFDAQDVDAMASAKRAIDAATRDPSVLRIKCRQSNKTRTLR